MMITPEELQERCKKLVSRQLGEMDSLDGEEIVEDFLQDQWIRIMLVRNQSKTSMITIEVELSLPSGIVEEAYDNNSDTSVIVRYAKDMIGYLEYMLSLHRYGFKISMIGEDCMWTATKKFTGVPDLETFKLLIPLISAKK